MNSTSLRTSLAGLAVSLMAGLGIVMPSGAQATTYQLDFVPSSGVVTSFGTVDITGGGTSITYAFDVTSGGDLHGVTGNGALETIVFDLGGTISTTAISNTSFSWSALNTSPNADGLGTFTDGFTCTNAGSGGNACGTTFTVTFTGTGLTADSTTTQGLQIFAGADVTCVATGASCPNDPGFNTGMVGAAAPLPGTLALFLGPLFAGGGFMGLRRRRRTRSLAAA